ncbi:MAG: sigma 54-interacting transcriptional regulator, partial [bacterium]
MTNRFIHPKTTLSNAVATEMERDLHADCIAVWITAKTPVASAGTDLGFLTTDLKARSVLLIHEGTPLDAALLDAWRTHLATKLQCEIRCLFVRGDEESNALLVTMKTRFANLLGPKPEPEASGLTRGQWIKADNGGHSTMRLTMFFDSLGELLTSMDAIKQRFRRVLAAEIPKRKAYLEALYAVLENPKQESAAMQAITKKFAALENRCDQLPRVLLFGETGVGKTLFANYLGGDKPVDRISIAEFANKEDMFEYAFFGYCKGAFTDARDEGDPGLLL